MNNASSNIQNYDQRQLAAMRRARDLGSTATSPAKHHAASQAFLALAADTTFSDDDRDAFARMAAEHHDRA